MPVGLHNGNQFIALRERQRADSGFARGIEACQFQPFDSAVSGNKDKIILVEFMHGDTRRDLLARLKWEDIDQIRALGRAACLRDLIALAAVHLAEVREEEDIVMRGGGKHALYEVLLLRRHARDASAAALLAAVGRSGNTLAVARMGKRKDALLLFDQVFNVDLVLNILNFSQTIIAVFIADGSQFVLQNALEHFLAGQQFAVIRNALFEFLIFRFQLLAFESLQTLKLHVQHDLRLNLGQIEPLHQALFCVVIAFTDGLDDLVDIVLGNEQTLQHMLPVERFFEIVLRPLRDDLFLEGQIFIQHMPQGQNLRLLLVVDQRKHRHARRGLHLRLANSRFKTTCGFASFFSSITTRMPLRSVSSRISEMPSSRLSRTCSAMLAISWRLLT